MVKRGRLGEVSEMSQLPLRGYSVSGMYVPMYVILYFLAVFSLRTILN
jgi:hypothetical protein